jgi:MFS family permease
MSDDQAAFTIDLSGGEDETPAGKVGRVLGGLLLLIFGALIALASLVGYIVGGFIPDIADWYDLIGDGILVIGFIGLGLAITGFEVMRRSRKKRRAAEAAEAAAVMEKLEAAGVYDGTATPQTIMSAMGEPFDEQPGDAPGVQATKPPIAGPTIT